MMSVITTNELMKLGRPAVLLAGDFMLDTYVYGNADRMSLEAPVPVLKVVRREHRCGGAASVAAALAALGGRPVCLGVIGQDMAAEQLTAMLREMGAEISGLTNAKDRPTTMRQRLVGLAQGRHQQQLMRVDEECDGPLDESLVQILTETFRQRLTQAALVCLRDHGKGVLTSSLTQTLIRLARDAGRRTVVDPGPGADFARYQGADWITPNRFEASQAVGFTINTIEQARHAAVQLRDRFGLGGVVITLDRDGAMVASDEVVDWVPTRPRHVYDVTGAGDMVVAAWSMALAGGWDPVQAAHLANLVAGIAVGKFGTATVTIDELINEVQWQRASQGAKLLSLDELLRLLQRQRDQGKTIVLTNGCYDVLHEGHTSCLRFCRQQGDVVVVGLNSDVSVRALKGPNRPVNSERDRASVLAALEAVDYITIFDDPSVLDLVKAVRPDVLVKGADYATRDVGVVGREHVEGYGGRVVLAPLKEGRSTTATIERIRLQNTAATE